MRRIHLFCNSLEKDGAHSSGGNVLSALIREIEDTVREQFYPTVRHAFQPFVLVPGISSADIAVLTLGNQDTTDIKEMYYRAFVQDIPIFIIVFGDGGTETKFRREIFSRHPHFVITESNPRLHILKEYLSDFFHRELKNIFIPRYSQIPEVSLQEGYRRNLEVFERPDQYSHASTILAREHVLLLYGPPHSGKSCLAHNLMNDYHTQGFLMNEILSPLFTPQLFTTISNNPRKMISCLDTDAYSSEWEWQITEGVFRIILATITKSADATHPFIIVCSGQKMNRMLEKLWSQQWKIIDGKSLKVPSFQLDKDRAESVIRRHLLYYKVSSPYDEDVLAYFRENYRPEITPALIFYTIRFILFPQGIAARRKLPQYQGRHVSSEKMIFEQFMRTATLKEIILLYLTVATEMELSVLHLEELAKKTFHYILFIEGKIVDFIPEKQHWPRHILNEMSGALIRRYVYDEEERIVFTHRTIRASVSRFLKQHASTTRHRFLIEGIVSFLMQELGQQGKYLAIKFVCDHFRAFSPDFRKQFFYSLMQDRHLEVRGYLLKQLYRIIYIIGTESPLFINALLHNAELPVQIENAHGLALIFPRLHKPFRRLIKTILHADVKTVQSQFVEKLALNYGNLDSRGKQIIHDSASHSSREVRAALIFSLLVWSDSLSKKDVLLLKELCQERHVLIDKSIARALLYLSPELHGEFLDDWIPQLLQHENGFLRSQVVSSIGTRLPAYSPGIEDVLFARSTDESPLVRKEVIQLAVKNFMRNPEKIFSIIMQMVREPRPYLRTTIASVLIEYFSCFSSEQQALLLKQFLQVESIDGIRESLSELISSHFELLKPDTEELYFRNSDNSDPRIRAHLAEQIVIYYERLQQKSRALLTHLVTDPDERVRMRIVTALVKHCQNIPKPQFLYLFEELSSDKNEYIRAHLAKHFSSFCSCLSAFDIRSTLDEIMNDTELVRSNIAYTLLEDPKAFAIDISPYIERLMNDLSVPVRLSLLKSLQKYHQGIPGEWIITIIEKFSLDASQDVRFETFQMIVQLSPHLDESIRSKLLPLLHKVGTQAESRLNRELEMAAEIQRKLLPQKLPRLDGYSFSFLFAPARVIGGDLLGFFPLSAHQLAIVIADISGKGIPAALLMANLQAWLRALLEEEPLPEKVVPKLNNVFWESTQGEKFVSLVYGILDSLKHTFSYVNAGHNYPMMYNSIGELTLLQSGGPVLGIFKDQVFESEVVSFQPGSTLTLYTDGVTESMDENHNEFGDQRLLDIIKSKAEEHPKKIVSEIERQIQLFTNIMVPHDDISLTVIQRLLKLT